MTSMLKSLKNPYRHRFRAGLLVTGLLFFGGLVSGCMPANDNSTDDAVTLHWDAPLTRVDGSKLYPGEIREYRVYYRNPGDSGFEIEVIEEAGTTQWQPSDLPAGNYRFAVSTVDTSGLESARSETLSVTIP